MTPRPRKREPDLFLNRELSWLEFNHRVLEEALDPQTPLLERLKFVAIVASNLDEFFMVRVAGLENALLEGDVAPDVSGLTPTQQLRAISDRAHAMVARLYEALGNEILPGLVARFSRQFGPDAYDEATLEYYLSRILRLRATFSDAQSLASRNAFRRVERAGVDLILFFSF